MTVSPGASSPSRQKPAPISSSSTTTPATETQGKPDVSSESAAKPSGAASPGVGGMSLTPQGSDFFDLRQKQGAPPDQRDRSTASGVLPGPRPERSRARSGAFKDSRANASPASKPSLLTRLSSKGLEKSSKEDGVPDDGLEQKATFSLSEGTAKG